jgi:hypothetical protein
VNAESAVEMESSHEVAEHAVVTVVSFTPVLARLVLQARPTMIVTTASELALQPGW